MGSSRVSISRVRRGPGSSLRVRTLRVVLWLLVAAGPVLFLLLAMEVEDLHGRIQSSAAVEAAPRDTSRVEGLAELVVADFVASDGSDAGVSSPSSLVSVSTVSVGAVEVEPGYFSVLVAVRMSAVTAAGSQSTSFFRVGVVDSQSGLVAVSGPALVARPAEVEAPRVLVEATGGVESPDLEETVARFFDAYLAGVGELDRYTTPDSPLLPVNPVPFAAVELVSVGESPVEDRIVVAASVSAVDGAGRLWEFDYWLDVVRRDGRWEIVDLLAAPPLVND